MGAHHSHENVSSEQGQGSGASTPRRGSQRGAVSRSGSGGDLQLDKPQPTSMVPIEKLGKLLVQRAQKEDGVNGVTENSFTRYLFPMYPELARQFYQQLHRAAKCKNQHIPLAAFKQQCERVLSILDDEAIIETYVRMFSTCEDDDHVTQEGLRRLLYTSYKISMDHYPDGPQTCFMINRTLTAVVAGCFNKRESHSVGFVVRWISEHCHRIVAPVHRYCVHMLATRHRELSTDAAGDAPNELGLSTPVLERAGPRAALLAPSAAWLLAATLPPLYSRPQPEPDGVSLPRAWLARLVCAVPSHWTPLYASREHGMGANRFLHHTTAYRGPTIMVLGSEALTLVVGCPVEWRETHQYWGTENTVLAELYPTFSIIERGPKMLYLNTSIRGYPRGLRVGSDPRQPLLSIHEDFDKFTLRGAPYQLNEIEVWGCGDPTSREAQLDVKKWQVKEAERQSQVKLSPADWIEHPDRYLLELAGRPQYNNSGS